jgi:hypothetical protein
MNVNDFPDTTKKYLEDVILDHVSPLLYGSISQPQLLYKGDIDMMSILKTKNRERVYKEIKDILRTVLNNKDSSFFVSEIKFGENVEIKNQINKFLKDNDRKGLLKYITNIKKPSSEIVDLIKSKNTDENKYKLADELRDYYIKRWTAQEILKGDADYLLEQENELVFKVDFQFFNSQRFVETSNFIVFMPFVEEKDSEGEFIKSLTDNIKKTYYSDANIYKCIKRLYSYYKQRGNNKKLEFFENIINDPVLGNIYLILTEFKVLQTIHEFNKPNNKLFKDKFKMSIDSLKNNTLYFDDKDMKYFNNLIDKLKEMEPIKAMPKIDSEIKKMKKILNEQTLKELKKYDFSLEDEIKKF